VGLKIDTATSTEQLQVGERIRNLRTALNLSVRTLASDAGFSPSFISQVENGVVSPSIASLEHIASVLGVTLAGFFTVPQPWVNITRTDERQEIASSWSRARIESLIPHEAGRRLEAVMITLSPGGRSGRIPLSHPGEEFALIFDGSASLTLGDAVHNLRRGDTISFGSEVPHMWENTRTRDARIVIISPRFTH